MESSMELHWPVATATDPLGILIKTKEFADPNLESLNSALEESDSWAR